MARTTRPCRHCGRTRPNEGRGLCRTCWYDPGVRLRYAPDPQCRDATMAELDALIEQQLLRLPPWWAKEVAEQERLNNGPRTDFDRNPWRRAGTRCTGGRRRC